MWCIAGFGTIYLYNLKNVKNTHGGVLLFFTFFNLYKWYQIAQRITYGIWNNDNLDDKMA